VAAATPGRVVDSSNLDFAAAERATRDLLRAIGADPDTPDLLDTPRRVAASFAELVTPAEFGATVFPNEGYDELVLVRRSARGVPAGRQHHRSVEARARG
jgi:GTP cyclohydrolase I